MSEPFRHKGRHDKCRGKDCGAAIVWLKTMRGGYMPCNPDGVHELDEYYDHTRHVGHHATCPNAEEFRKKRGPR